jgi:Fe-S-cluster containining protein
MNDIEKNTSFFSQICINRCKGCCCDPWWGIISYTIIKEGGLSHLNDFKAETIKGINARAHRIGERYVTNEASPKPLFNLPEKYNITVRDINIQGNKLAINILAMFAFRCLFLSEEKVCTIHPAMMNGIEIRPPHCGFMGSLDARQGEKGYCRIIHAASDSLNNDSAINTAIDIERCASERHYREGWPTADLAADAVIDRLKEYCSRYAAHLLPVEKQVVPGRNEPCYCGSKKKYKKCHGR